MCVARFDKLLHQLQAERTHAGTRVLTLEISLGDGLCYHRIAILETCFPRIQLSDAGVVVRRIQVEHVLVFCWLVDAGAFADLGKLAVAGACAIQIGRVTHAAVSVVLCELSDRVARAQFGGALEPGVAFDQQITRPRAVYGSRERIHQRHLSGAVIFLGRRT